MTATKEKYVTIAYNFSTPDGFLLGTSDRQGPLTFCAGSGDILPGLDSRVEGAAEGEQRSFVIPPAEAYGERDESLVLNTTAQALALPGEPQVGYRVEAQIGGRWRSALIADVRGDQVTVDANHPLAGIPLHFNCTVLTISDEPPVMQGCGCGGGGCGSGGGCDSGGCGSHAEGAEGQACGCGGSCDCGGH